MKKDKIKELKKKIKERGYEMGKIDGVLGVEKRDEVR